MADAACTPRDSYSTQRQVVAEPILAVGPQGVDDDIICATTLEAGSIVTLKSLLLDIGVISNGLLVVALAMAFVVRQALRAE